MAYGARLESVLGASPRGFESPILRHRTPGPLQVPGFLLLVPRLISGRRESCPPASRPRRELRSARRLEARPCPPVPPAPSAPAAPCCCVWLSASSRSPARPRHRPPAPWPGPPAPSTPAALVVLGLARPCPAAAHRHRGQAMQPSPPSLGVLWWPAIGRSRAAEPRPRPLRLRGLRRSLHPGARPGPRPSQRASSGAGPSRCSSIRPRTPSR